MATVEQIKGIRYLAKGAARRARLWHKRAASRLRRRLGRVDPQDAPVRVTKGWAD